MMADFKQQLDEKIRKLQVLRELADDPEMMDILRTLVSSNGNGHKVSEPPATKIATTIGTDPSKKRGFQKRTVLEVLRSAAEPVTTDWIADQMKRRGFEFKAATPAIAVNEALKTLAETRDARIARTEGVRNFWEATAPQNAAFQMEAMLHK